LHFDIYDLGNTRVVKISPKTKKGYYMELTDFLCIYYIGIIGFLLGAFIAVNIWYWGKK